MSLEQCVELWEVDSIAVEHNLVNLIEVRSFLLPQQQNDVLCVVYCVCSTCSIMADFANLELLVICFIVYLTLPILMFQE